MATEQLSASQGRSELGDVLTEQPIRILAVDDEHGVLRSLSSLFRGRAYELHLADDGNRALELLEEQEVDVVISDMRMPEMGGAEFLSEVQERFPEVMRIVLSGYADSETVISVLNQAGIFAYVNKPWDNSDLRTKVHRAAEQRRLKRRIQEQNAELAQLNESLEEKVLDRTAQLERAWSHLHLAMLDLEDSYQAVVKMLAHVAERRMPGTQGCKQRVARTARYLAQALRLPNDQIRDIETAALLQDIGLVVVPDQILTLRPECMSEEQLVQFRRHPELGEMTLMSIPAMRQVAAVIRAHHEFYDGSGFPDGLTSEAIPLGARIITLANEYREYLDGDATGDALSATDAFARVLRDSGHRYDPYLVDLLGRLIDEPLEPGQVEVQEVSTLCSAELKPGMVLCEKVLSQEGILLLSAGQRITQHAIDGIRRLERQEGATYLFYVFESEADEQESLPGQTQSVRSRPNLRLV